MNIIKLLKSDKKSIFIIFRKIDFYNLFLKKTSKCLFKIKMMKFNQQMFKN